MSAIEEVKARTDIVEVVGERVPLKKAGRNFKGLCPFHDERTPSFIVFPDSQNYHCFGCGAGGDVFTFLMQQDNLTFPEALRTLARRAGIVLRPPTPQEEEADRERQRLQEMNLAAARFFHQQLLYGDGGAIARSYLQERGIDEETINTFQVGYAPDSWDALSMYLKERGYGDEDMLTAGLVIERDSGGSYDRFRHRLMFPIRDRQGHVIGFGGRMLDEERPPKYMNSPQTPLFDKSTVLYGLDQAASAIRKEGRVVLVEGYFDVLTAYQHGYKNIVAPMGTALTEEQVGVLKRLTDRLILALDADTAGTMATLRGLEVIREVMDERQVPVPTAKGLVRFEKELDGEVRIVLLPSGRDPDEVIRENPSEWPERLDRALPVLEYVLQNVVRQADLSTAKGKAEVVESVLPLLKEVHNPVEQGHYIQRLAHLVKVEERAIMAQLRREKPARGRRTSVLPPQVAIEASEEEIVEGFFIALLFAFPRMKETLPAGVPSLLSQEEHRVLLGLLGEEDETEGLPVDLREYLERLNSRFQTHLELEPEIARQALAQCLERLEGLAIERQYRQYSYMVAQAEEEGDRDRAREMLRQLASLSQRRGTIPTPPPSRLYPDLRRYLGEDDESSTLEML
jgi:DNA primase